MKQLAQHIAQRLPHPLKHRLKKRWQLFRGGAVDLSKHSFSNDQHVHPADDRIAGGFQRLAPWFSEFELGGKKYGGKNSYVDDIRIRDFVAWCTPRGRLLELGCFEAAHTLQLAQLPNVTEVLGLEGRDYLLEKCRYIAELYSLDSVSFLQSDFEVESFKRFGQFDAVFCSGVLYHLTHPWQVLRRLAKITDKLFLATHYAPDAETERDGYTGRLAPEFGYFEPLSGLNSYSFWLTLDSLRKAASDAGFELVRERTVPHWDNGPWVNAYFKKSE